MRGARFIPDLLNLIYEAATDSSAWDSVLGELAKATRSSMASFLVQDFDRRHGNALWQFGADPALIAEYEHWAPRNPWLLVGAPNRIQTGDVRNAESVVPDDVAVKTEFFNEFLSRLNVLHNIGACLFREEKLVGMLNVFRPLGRPSYGDGDVRFFRILMPHLQRAILIHRRLHEVDFRRGVAEDALDRLPIGVILLDLRGRALFVNRAGQTILHQRDGLVLGPAGLDAARPSESVKLHKAIATACGPQQTEWREAGGWVSVSRASGRRAFVVTVSPLRVRDALLTSSAPGAIVLVGDPERKSPHGAAALREIYGLTPAEATVTLLLVEGARIDEIGEQLSITLNTARTHVKRIFDKIGARTQSDVVRLVLANPGITCSQAADIPDAEAPRPRVGRALSAVS